MAGLTGVDMQSDTGERVLTPDENKASNDSVIENALEKGGNEIKSFLKVATSNESIIDSSSAGDFLMLSDKIQAAISGIPTNKFFNKIMSDASKRPIQVKKVEPKASQVECKASTSHPVPPPFNPPTVERITHQSKLKKRKKVMKLKPITIPWNYNGVPVSFFDYRITIDINTNNPYTGRPQNGTFPDKPHAEAPKSTRGMCEEERALFKRFEAGYNELRRILYPAQFHDPAPSKDVASEKTVPASDPDPAPATSETSEPSTSRDNLKKATPTSMSDAIASLLPAPVPKPPKCKEAPKPPKCKEAPKPSKCKEEYEMFEEFKIVWAVRQNNLGVFTDQPRIKKMCEEEAEMFEEFLTAWTDFVQQYNHGGLTKPKNKKKELKIRIMPKSERHSLYNQILDQDNQNYRAVLEDLSRRDYYRRIEEYEAKYGPYWKSCATLSEFKELVDLLNYAKKEQQLIVAEFRKVGRKLGYVFSDSKRFRLPH